MSKIKLHFGLMVTILVCWITPLVGFGQVTSNTIHTDPSAIHDVVLHPPLRAKFTCIEHPEGRYDPGASLGSDCMVIEIDPRSAEPWPKLYRDNGSQNEHWYGWGKSLLAPLTGTVELVHINPATNKPGEAGREKASMIVFLREDGLRVMYAHVMDVEVATGDSIVAGEVVGKVGNNGVSFCPHTHIGAWKDNEPLQIRFDLRGLAQLLRSN